MAHAFQVQVQHCRLPLGISSIHHSGQIRLEQITLRKKSFIEPRRGAEPVLGRLPSEMVQHCRLPPALPDIHPSR